MRFHVAWLTVLVTSCAVVATVGGAQQRVMLSDSYLPVVMQVIANLVDQMAFETKDEPPPTSRPPVRPNDPMVQPTSRPTHRPPTTTTTTPRPTAASDFGINRPTHHKPSAPSAPWKPQGGGWSMSIGSGSYPTSAPQAVETTTPFHKPGLFAPERPPLPGERTHTKPTYILLPVQNDPEEYTVIRDKELKDQESFLNPELTSDFNPIIESTLIKETLLPIADYNPTDPDVPKEYAHPRSTDESSLELGKDELNENNLQYVSEDLRDMLRLAHDPNDERAFDIDADGFGKASNTKPKLNQSNLRMQLLYDLLSREAKKQKLSDFGGFEESVLRELRESSGGGARAQLRVVLSHMLERKHCQHEYANNRAREMVAELARDDSLLSSELRYLQPLQYA